MAADPNVLMSLFGAGAPGAGGVSGLANPLLMLGLSTLAGNERGRPFAGAVQGLQGAMGAAQRQQLQAALAPHLQGLLSQAPAGAGSGMGASAQPTAQPAGASPNPLSPELSAIGGGLASAAPSMGGGGMMPGAGAGAMGAMAPLLGAGLAGAGAGAGAGAAANPTMGGQGSAALPPSSPLAGSAPSGLGAPGSSPSSSGRDRALAAAFMLHGNPQHQAQGLAMMSQISNREAGLSAGAANREFQAQESALDRAAREEQTQVTQRATLARAALKARQQQARDVQKHQRDLQKLGISQSGALTRAQIMANAQRIAAREQAQLTSGLTSQREAAKEQRKRVEKLPEQQEHVSTLLNQLGELQQTQMLSDDLATGPGARLLNLAEFVTPGARKRPTLDRNLKRLGLENLKILQGTGAVSNTEFEAVVGLSPSASDSEAEIDNALQKVRRMSITAAKRHIREIAKTDRARAIELAKQLAPFEQELLRMEGKLKGEGFPSAAP